MGRQKLLSVDNNAAIITQELQTDIFNGSTPEFFINMNPKDIPPKGHPDRPDFVKMEKDKCRTGLNINGVPITGRLYYHLNYYKMVIDSKDNLTNEDVRIVSNPLLRDNEWIIFNAYEEAVKNKAAFQIGGSRQISKSESLCSLSTHAMNLYKNPELLLLFANAPDKQTLIKKLLVAIQYGEPFMFIPNIDKDWKKTEIRFGYTQKDNESNVHGRLFMYNTDGGNSSEIGTGKTPTFFAYDENAKESCISAISAVTPALISPSGLRCSPFYAFCVCEGTKVWNSKGDLKLIEELTPEEGIIGWDINTQKFSKESISYWQDYTEKSCVRITTNSGKYLECSTDHPILTRRMNAFYKERTYLQYVDATKLTVGDNIACINGVDVFGKEKMEDARLTGWLVGDGTYRIHGNSCGVKLINADQSIWNYVESKYSTKDTVIPVPTKDGRILRKVSIHNFVPELRRLGIAGQTKDNKRLPNNIHSYCKEHICEFLGGYFDADGCVYINKTSSTKTNNFEQCLIKVSSSNIEILKETQMLLLKLDIHSKISYCKPNFNNPKTTRGHYNLNIYERDSLLNFIDNVYFYVEHKQQLANEMKEILLKNPKKQKVFKLSNLNLEKIIKIEDIGIKRVFNLTANNTNTYVASGFITHNTGGNVEKSKDAEELFFNPKAHNIQEFENEGKKTGCFVGGWYRQDFKKPQIFTNYLKDKGYNITKPSIFDKMEILVTDFDLANQILDNEQLESIKSKDPTALLKHKMYFPRNLKEMFTKNSTSNFKKEYISQQREYIKSNLNVTYMETKRDMQSKIPELVLSNKKPITQYPKESYHDGDAPLCVYDLPKYKGFGVHVLGLDPIREDEAATSDSLGSFYVWRRNHNDLTDPFRDKMVVSYKGRLKTVKEFHEMILDVAEIYDAKILYEHSDRAFLDFFEGKNKTHLLIDAIPIQREINPKSKSSNTKGLRPTAQNKAVLYATTLGLVNEEMEDGILGYAKILDDVLLQELDAYDPDLNMDCYIAFSHVAQARLFYDKFGVAVVTDTKKELFTPPKKQITITSAFGFNPKTIPKQKSAFGF